MKIEVTELHWVDDGAACSLHELAAAAQLSEAELRELVELGVLQPLAAAGVASSPSTPEPSPAGAAVVEPLFAAGCLPRLRALRRMRHDLELDAHGASVALALLERIGELERQLRQLQAQLPRSLP